MACALQVGDAAVRLEGAVMMAHVLSAGKLAAQLEAPAELHGNVVETAVFRIPLSAARVMVTIATWAISVAELGIASYQVENAAEIVNGTCRPGYRCVINSAGVRGCRAGTSGGGGSSIAAEPSSRGDSVSNSPSTRTPITTPAPDPTTPPSVEYRWFTTTIYWYYYWYYYVWVSTIDYTSTRSSRTSTSTTVSAYVSAFSAASRSFESIASDLTTSTPSQYTTEFEGPTPTPVEAATSSEASTATPAPSNTGGSNSPGNDITNVGGGGGDNAPSTASQYRARDVLVFAPIVFLLTLIYML
ncbi:hypothetical protein TWF594_006898 [Orbilia oligospora]|uniref:Uncharacterized protein n=1 Tax=Orbilia oligospora TaxID=2813651 RepID=A0A7C8JW52_ORBOL|nr:hypothetical protein TWF706_009646 [Orbilia oligospora]KAF3129422.1 hypothetical protein TWF703_008887 [Orbilia oligospora]KAF3138707.1 hypothetical protein TWF594_006898 [Orbilia oligospora]